MKWILWFMIMAGFLFACFTDCRTCEVYNFTWWISGTAAVLLWFASGGAVLASLSELGSFCLIQLFGFSRMYGRADCYAFCVCAIVESACGLGLLEYLIHMLLAVSMLAVIQLLHHNIDRRGNLIHPVPFLPYITVTFAVVLLIF